MKSLWIILILLSSKAFALWNGELARPGQFPATIYLKNCTGVKVAEKYFATAAHCVLERHSYQPLYKKGSKISIGYGVRSKEKDAKKDKIYELEIVEMHVHPTYLNAKNKKQRNKASDIALFKVNKKTKEIAVAKFSFYEPEVYQDVIIGGYGLDGPSIFDFTLDGTAVVHGDGLLPLAFAKHSIERISTNMITFRGPQMNEMEIGPEPILDYGDSGGPVYDAEDVLNLTVIGINSIASTLRIYSSSTRVDDETANKVGPWIRSILKIK